MKEHQLSELQSTILLVGAMVATGWQSAFLAAITLLTMFVACMQSYTAKKSGEVHD